MNKLSLQERKNLYSLISTIRGNNKEVPLIILNDNPCEYTTDIISLTKELEAASLPEMNLYLNDCLKTFDAHQLKVENELNSIELNIKKEVRSTFEGLEALKQMLYLKEKRKLQWLFELAKGTKIKKLSPSREVVISHIEELVAEDETEKALSVMFFCEANLIRLSSTCLSGMTYSEFIHHNRLCSNLAEAIANLSYSIDSFRNHKVKRVSKILNMRNQLKEYNESIMPTGEEVSLASVNKLQKIIIGSYEDENSNVISIDE